ncbi:hypothetical protein VP01_3861g3 [Puccinia sorghi]|uniref:Integrase catalytic domain-containing protein n=1 Tax=Puccinia sorghi TaxID=27349 RepID=A0A0L6UUY4_9BASI|nr:hypothetical protein VP01_3861g3 [Puccinia sorghi]
MSQNSNQFKQTLLQKTRPCSPKTEKEINLRETTTRKTQTTPQSSSNLAITIQSKAQNTLARISGIFIQTKRQSGGRDHKPNGKLSGDPRGQIILYSGASAHIFNDKKFFNHLEMGRFDSIKTGKKDATLPIKGRGTVKLTWGDRTIQLEDCLFVPDILINTISTRELSLKVCEVHAKESTFSVSKEKFPEGKNQQRSFSLSKILIKSTMKINTWQIFSLQENPLGMHTMNLSISKSERVNFECKSCVLAKITKQPFKERSTTVLKPFERLHLDLVGPVNPESSLKHQYFLTVVNNHSGYLARLPLVHKNDTTDALITSLLESEHKMQGYYPTTICSDGGGEFVGNRLAKFFHDHQFQKLISKPYHPEHNGRSKRANRTIFKSMRVTINSSGIQKRFCHEILKSCCLGLNTIPWKGILQSPWEILHGKSFPIGLLKSIGMPAIVLKMAKAKGRKLDSKGEEGTLVGFNVQLLSYQIITCAGKVIETKHVRFLKKRETQSSC